MVHPAPRRHPALLAKSAASLDVLSGGRLTIGMGAGDPSTVHMYSQWGLEFPPRSDRVPLLEEHTQVQKLLYTAPTADFDGRFFQLALDAACAEIGRDPNELTRARFCLALVTDGSWELDDALKELARASGRYDPESFGGLADMWLGVLFGTSDGIQEQIAARVEELGFDHLMCHFYGLGLDGDAGGIEGFQGNAMAAVRAFGTDVMPAFRGPADAAAVQNMDAAETRSPMKPRQGSEIGRYRGRWGRFRRASRGIA